LTRSCEGFAAGAIDSALAFTRKRKQAGDLATIARPRVVHGSPAAHSLAALLLASSRPRTTSTAATSSGVLWNWGFDNHRPPRRPDEQTLHEHWLQPVAGGSHVSARRRSCQLPRQAVLVATAVLRARVAMSTAGRLRQAAVDPLDPAARSPPPASGRRRAAAGRLARVLRRRATQRRSRAPESAIAAVCATQLPLFVAKRCAHPAAVGKRE